MKPYPIHFFVLILLLFLSFETAVALRVEIPSSPNPVGSGARALGMGGAFIAVADDATAASWNPGGLIQLEKPEVSLVAYGFSRREKNSFGNQPDADGSRGDVDKTGLNYFSAAYPFNLKGYNMIVSLNYQTLYNFSREWQFNLHNEGSNFTENFLLDYKQTGDLAALGLAYCIQIRPSISWGFTLNLWNDSLFENTWHEKTYQSGSGTSNMGDYLFDTRRDDTYRFKGVNANMGVLWQATGKLTLGAVIKTPFEADLDHTKKRYDSFYFPATETDNPTTSVTNETLQLTMPLSYGIGAAYRFSDALTVSMDLYRTLWGDFKLEDESGDAVSPVTGQPFNESRVDHTIQFRMGAEYLYILPKCLIPLRAGFFYDPSPAAGAPDDYYGLSMGSGLSFKRFSWDISWQCRVGHDVSRALMPGYDFSQDVEEYTVYTSLILYL